MSASGTDFLTTGGEQFEVALGNDGVLNNGTHFGRFGLSHGFIEKISKKSRNDNLSPNEDTLGRECYSFSERENRAFVITANEAKSLAAKIGTELSIETDPIGNLYIKVEGGSERTHMVGSHLDSVENGGKYDGPAGVAAGLEILQQVLHHKKEGTLQNSFCLTVFRSEESGPHNGVACLGSAVATGNISSDKLEQIVYKNENGIPVSLKDHLESSLRRYFEAVEIDARCERREMLWGEGDDYIDHEWWYFFCEEQGISKENYSDGIWWEKISDSLLSPKISRKNTASYHELHIEQGTIIENAEVDGKQVQLGIVSGGIGGAKRYKTTQAIGVESEELSAGDYEVYSFEVLGFSDHTGSTPNNPELENSEYRRDANIATNLFLKEFLEQDFGNLVSSEVNYEPGNKNPEGFTKVPFHQNISLAINKDKRNEFESFYAQYIQELQKSTKTQFTSLSYTQAFGKIRAVSRDSAISTVSTLLGISKSASQEFQRQKQEDQVEKQFGTTRATLTNVCLSSQGLDFSLDVREVDADDVGILTDKISTQLQDIIPEGLSGLNKVSEKIHQKIDKSLRDRAKKVADILGYTTIFLPSVPGHDADRIAAAGIPIGMIFVRQENGVSHNPGEKMRKRDYNIACHTMMKAVLANMV
ncbi:M20/M25/M40 family metallo-hydrolase [Candidatus Gracilibacteria bacterium]|nr:M20/M25/M40 family metallo-hydrolase [Candidatus Gracilibacteria bacterium]